MTSNNEPEFLELMAQIGHLYGKAINETLFDIYWKALESFDFAAVKRAFQTHINNPDTGQYMPKPADIIRYLHGTTQTQALHAWSQVLEAIQRVGAYESVVFDDPLIHTVITEMGGWIRLCRIDEKDLPFRAHNFEKRYMGWIFNPPIHYPKHLAGILELHYYQEKGYETPPPLLIGNQEKALLVYEGGHDPRTHSLPILPLNKIVEQLPIIPHYLETSDENK